MKVNVLVDNHLHAAMESYEIADFSIEAMERFVEAVRPTRLTVFAVGHDGLAQYPSNISKVAPGLPIDLVGMWRKIARDRNISFGIYVSTLRNDVLLTEYPSWVRYRLGGANSGKIDHTSPFLQSWLKPVLCELYEMYAPDGFFFDGDYWAVGESTISWRADAAQLKWPGRGENAFSTLSSQEHRLLTVETYEKYLRDLGEFLFDLDEKMVSSVNLAFTFRHPTSPPKGLQLVTSDLPPFYGALESWIETAVLLPDKVRRDLVVPLYAEPEGGGRKYPKSVPQLIHETGPLVASGEQIHVYFPMSRSGSINQTYIGSLNEMRLQIEMQEAKGEFGSFGADFDVLCLSDTEKLQLSQDFGNLRGAFLAACTSGLNVGIAPTQRCRERLSRTRLIIVPTGSPTSSEAEQLIEEAIAANVTVLGPNEAGFADRMSRANWDLQQATVDEISRAYWQSKKQTTWSQIEISRPWSTFTRGLIDEDGRWRLFLWNGIKSGIGIGRHVRDNGAGYAGLHNVRASSLLNLDRCWGYGEDFVINERTAQFVMTGAFTVVEGTVTRDFNS